MSSTLSTKIAKTTYEVPLAVDLQTAINTYGDAAVMHCFRLGASQQFYRFITGLLKLKGKDKPTATEQEAAILSFLPYAPPTKKKPVSEMNAEERLVYAKELELQALEELSQPTTEEEVVESLGVTDDEGVAAAASA